MHSPNSNRKIGHQLLFLFIIACTAWSVWSTIQRQNSVPSRETWSMAAEHIKAHFQEKDFVTWYPEWASESRLALHSLPVIPLPQQGEVDFAQANRLWVLGAFDRDGVHLSKSSKYQIIQRLSLLSQTRYQAQDSGSVTVSLMQVQGALNLHELYDELDDPSSVIFSRRKIDSEYAEKCDFWALGGWHCSPDSHSLQKRATSCLARPQAQQLKRRSRRRDLYTLDRRRWLPYIDCRLHPTEHLSRDWRVIDESPKRCISAIPHQGRLAQLSWFVPMQPKAIKIWFKYGWEDLALRHPFRASKAQALKVELKQANQILFADIIHPKLGWFTKKFTVKAHKDLEGPPAPYLLSYQATQGINDANFCFTMSIRQPGDL